MSAIDAIGWAATALFAASYFCKEPTALRRTQALAALVWIAYGVALKSAPVIVANVLPLASRVVPEEVPRVEWWTRGARAAARSAIRPL